jgi:hypothetical protein
MVLGDVLNSLMIGQLSTMPLCEYNAVMFRYMFLDSFKGL